MTAFRDDDLTHLADHGTPPLPAGRTGPIATDGAEIWFTDVGAGHPLVLLHGGMGNAGNFARQVPALVSAGYRVIGIDTRGHGHSSHDGRPLTYDLLAADTLAVMDALDIDDAAIVGWSDGACTGLALARLAPARVTGLFFFACNVDTTGTHPFVPSPIIDRIWNHHQRDYAALSPTPDRFEPFAKLVQQMQQTLPNYIAADLAAVRVPVTVVQAENDEFIRREHAQYIAATIPGARFELLPSASHFAPLQRPDVFNAAVLDFLARTYGPA